MTDPTHREGFLRHRKIVTKTMLTIAELEYECLGDYRDDSFTCTEACFHTSLCIPATFHIPHCSIEELPEYIVSKWLGIRTIAEARLRELQK